MISTIKKELILVAPLVNPRIYYLPVNLLQRLATQNPVPYSLLALAALTPKDYSVKIINQKQFWSRRDFKEGALIAITCLTSTAPESYRLADSFRRAGSHVILGGPHVTAMPQEASDHADSIVIGEAESVWSSVVGDYERGRLQKIYKGKPLEDFFAPVYDYFLRLDPDLLVRAGIHIARGCKYHCDFCARISKWLRFVKIEQVIELIKRMKEAHQSFFIRRPFIIFRCDNIYSSPAYAKELFKKMIALNIIWSANCSIDIGFDEEALDLARDSGCERLLIGFEGIYPKDYRKTSLEQFTSVEDYKIAIRNIKARGIKIFGSFIIGQERYTHKDYLKLLWFLVRAGLWHIFLLILTPFPGTELFDRLTKEGRIVSFNWRKYDMLTCVVKPRRVSVVGVYFWFWLIRGLSCFFSPLPLIGWLAFVASWQAAYHISRWLMFNF